MKIRSHQKGHSKWVFIALFALAIKVYAGNQWNGEGDGLDWFDAANWSEGVPTIGQEVILTTGNVLLTNETFALTSFTMSGGMLIFSNWTTRLQADTVVVSGGTLTLPPAFTEQQMSNRVWIACEDFTLGTNAVIMADFRGYAPAQGAGKAGATRSGAGHGGTGSPGYEGWNKAGVAYDDVLAPSMPGSGGGGIAGGGRGGGAVWVQATGKFKIFGTVSADGQAGVTVHNGGGSGGSIRIDCHTFHGSSSGWLRARGGNGNNLGGPGSGGRIAILYDPAAQAALETPNSGVKFSAGAGPSGYTATLAKPGTLYLPAMETLFLDSMLTRQWDGVVAHIPGFDTWTVPSLTVAGKMALPSLRVLVITNDFVIASGGMLSLKSAPTNGISYDHGLAVDVGGSLAVTGTLYLACNPTNGAAPYVTAESLVVGPNGAINADGRGYGPEQGPGKGTSHAGGGHGGAGSPGDTTWSTAGAAYDDPLSPSAPGSGGGSSLLAGYGGGVVDIDVNADAKVYGTISANGMNAPGTHGGGGAGGAIRIRCQRLLGGSNGALRANGGSGKSLGGAGGGGRIAVLYEVSQQTGILNPGIKFAAAPGTAGAWQTLAEKGTVYLPEMETLFLSETLSSQWEGLNAWMPTVSVWSVESLTVAGKIAFPHLRELCVAGNLGVNAGGALTLQGGTNAFMTPDIGMYADIGGTLTVDGILELHADRTCGASPFIECRELNLTTGGSLLADYQGFNYETGYGAGTSRGGGGHGGVGGGGSDGGIAYGVAHAPIYPGSGGGNADDGGGRGGGALRIAAHGAMRLCGTISANGMKTKKVHGGGGAGGTILLTAKSFEGLNAVLRANGGDGLSLAHSGGGGRIALLSPCLSATQLYELANRGKPGSLVEQPPEAWPNLFAAITVRPGTRSLGSEGDYGTIFYGHLIESTLFMLR